MGVTHELTRSPPKLSKHDKETLSEMLLEEKKPFGHTKFKTEDENSKSAAEEQKETEERPIGKSSNKSEEASVKFFEKLKTLPNIKRELENTHRAYEQLKSFYPLTGFLIGRAEVAVKLYVASIAFILFSTPLIKLTESLIKKLKIVDELVCHQLDFLEGKLTPSEKGSIYRSGGIVHRFSLLLRLSLRLAFVFPRIGFRMAFAVVNSVFDEIHEDVTIFWDIVGSTHTIRESARRKAPRPAAANSPGKKRKREAEIEAKGLPEYFYEPINYCEGDDSDYVPEADDLDEVSSEEDDSEAGTEVERDECEVERDECEVERDECEVESAMSSSEKMKTVYMKSEADVIADAPISCVSMPLRL